MIHTNSDASLNALQASRITEYDFLRKPSWETFDEFSPKEVRHFEGSHRDIHISAIIVAAIIFLIIIAWFETLRLWIAYGLYGSSDNKNNSIIYDNAFSYLIYSVTITIFGTFILFIILR
jgi:hypothetical protein